MEHQTTYTESKFTNNGVHINTTYAFNTYETYTVWEVYGNHTRRAVSVQEYQGGEQLRSSFKALEMALKDATNVGREEVNFDPTTKGENNSTFVYRSWGTNQDKEDETMEQPNAFEEISGLDDTVEEMITEMGTDKLRVIAGQMTTGTMLDEQKALLMKIEKELVSRAVNDSEWIKTANKEKLGAYLSKMMEGHDDSQELDAYEFECHSRAIAKYSSLMQPLID